MSITDAHKSRRTARGFSFIELIIFIVIISIAVAGILMVMNYTTAHSADAQLRKQALAIAESLLEEIELARFTYCQPADPQLPAKGGGAMAHGGQAVRLQCLAPRIRQPHAVIANGDDQ